MNPEMPHAASNAQVLLNLGCGWRFHKEWNNLDFEPLGDEVMGYDITKGLPYPDSVFDAVYSAHFLEHLSPETTVSVLKECRRVLKSNSFLRLVVPDLEYSARLYLKTLEEVRLGKTQEAEEHFEWAGLNLLDQLVRSRPGGQLMQFLKKTHADPEFIRNTVAGPEYDAFQEAKRKQDANGRPSLKRRVKNAVLGVIRYGTPPTIRSAFHTLRMQRSGELHRWMYDSHSLTRLLKDLKFDQIKVMDAHGSDIPDFKDYGLDVDSKGVVQKPNSLFMESRRI